MHTRIDVQINHNLEFISQVNLEIKGKEIFDVDILGTHAIANHGMLSNSNDNWERIPGYKIIEKNKIIFYLYKPVNFSHFKFIFSGNFEETEEISPIYRYVGVIPFSNSRMYEFVKNKKIQFNGFIPPQSKLNEDDIRKIISVFEKIGSYFLYFKFNISYCIDCEELIQNTQIKYSFIECQSFFFDPELDDISSRTNAFSFARNKQLQNTYALQPDYFVIFDFDKFVNIESNLFINSFFSNFFLEPCWDAVFPSCNGELFDIKSFRHKEFVPNDFGLEIEKSPKIFNPVDLTWLHELFINLVDFRSIVGWLEVDSAFNGVGIYKTGSFRNNFYAYKNDSEDSEHVNFHSNAKPEGQGFLLIQNLF